jgi:hypothetical protein
MGQTYRVSLKEKMIKDVGERMEVLQKLLGFDSLQSFCDHLYLEPGSVRRLIKYKNAVPSFEFLARLCARVPNVNINWLISGKGNPLINQDQEFVHYEISELMMKLHVFKNQLETLGKEIVLSANMIEQAFDDENWPFNWAETESKKLRQRGVVCDDADQFRGLGKKQRTVLKKMEEGLVLYRHRGKYKLYNETIHATVIQSLIARDLIREKITEPGSYELVIEDTLVNTDK